MLYPLSYERVDLRVYPTHSEVPYSLPGMPNKTVIGVDLGGTNVRAQAFFEDGTPAGERIEAPSNAQKGTEMILEALASTINRAAASADSKPEMVGLAIPGHIDDEHGMVRWAPNIGSMVDGVFQYWQDVPISKPLEARIGTRVHMGNDANLAALGEYRFGVGKNSAHCLVMITLGTGIGGGVVLAPTSVHGHTGGPLLLLGGNKGGAELGHVIVQHGGLDCNAGTYGAIEAYCQRDGIIRRALHKLRRGRKSVIYDLVEGELNLVTPKTISLACDQGDAVALEIYREVGEFLGVGLGSFINIFAPDILAIGGQISKAGEYIIGPAREEAERAAIPSLFRDCTMCQAEHVDDAGIFGGAALAWEALGFERTS
ncbi:MAG: ROK family protein [Armatimonadetes bacterium]|nr:ROK family protein [Armatimonadota bacterium]